MKKTKDKFISISDLANEFHISKEAIELYGVHRLLLPIPDKKSKPAYRPIDKARLKFVIKAKNADYTIGDIKDMIGVIDIGKNEVDQIEESLVYSKKKTAAIKDNLEDLDALEQINATCDLELLEAYITDLNNLKYGLSDITPIKTVLPDPDTETPHAKPRTLVYSHVTDQINTSAPAIAPKKSRISLVVVAGIFLVAITGYLYLGGDLLPDISNNLMPPPQVDPVEMTTEKAVSNESDEINLSETESTSNEADEIYLSETNTNLDENVGNLADKPISTEDSFSQFDFPALKNELTPLPADPMGSRRETDSDEPSQNTKNTQALLDDINESEETTPRPDTPEKEETEDVFFKQLVADMKKKYNEQTPSQKPTTNDTAETSATSEINNDKKETQNLSAVGIPTDAPQADKTTAATTKPPPIKSTTAPPKKTAPLVVTQAPASSNTATSSTNTSTLLQSSPSSKPASSAIQTGSSTKQATASTKKAETSTLPKRNESTSKAITPPKSKPKPKPTAKPKTIPEPKTTAKTKTEPKPELEPKPKITPPKPANPEALKWAQKSYDSVMSGDAGGAIIAASVAITLDPNLVNAYINRSWAYSKKGLYDRAIQDCDKALDIENNNALAYNNRGLAFQGKGDMDKAKTDYERSCTLGFDIGCKNYQEVINLATN